MINIEHPLNTVNVSVVERTVKVAHPSKTIKLHDSGMRGLKGDPGEKGDPGDPATNLVTSVNGKQGVVVIDKTDVGLANVPNLDTTAAVANSHTHSNKSILDATTASFTTADETKLDGIAAGAEVNVNADWNAVSGDAVILNKPTIPTVPVDSVNGQTGAVVLDYTDVGADASGSASTALTTAQSYTDTAIANLVDSSPATLDTLNELAAALGDDPNFATTTATAIGLKENSANKSTSTSLGTSDTLFPTQNAVKSYVDTADGLRLLKSNNLSDLPNASTARTNLGLAIGSDVTAYGTTVLKTGDIMTGALQINATASTAVGQLTLTPSSSVTDARLLYFDTDRPWGFAQHATGAGTALELRAYSSDKIFRIKSNGGGYNTLSVYASTTNGNNALGIGLDPTPGSGRLQFATGTTAADGILFGSDVTLYRYTTNGLKTDDLFIAQSGLAVNDSGGVARAVITSAGALEIGSGSASRDTNLYRYGADQLATDDKFYAIRGLGRTNIITSPEATDNSVIPYYMNDLAYNRLRGGATRVYYDGVLQAGTDSNTDRLFDPTSTAFSINSTGITEVIIEIDMCVSLSYGTKVGIAVNPVWKSTNIKVEVYTTATATWTTLYNSTWNDGEMFWQHGGSANPISKLRYTFSGFNATYNIFRIGTIYTLNYSSAMGSGFFFTRDGGSIYGNTTLADGVNIITNTTTGTKIGTSTTQKLGLWNATPVVQQNTSVTAATFVAGAGTAVNDASTFDGYTIGKLVKALRNTGMIA